MLCWTSHMCGRWLKTRWNNWSGTHCWSVFFEHFIHRFKLNWVIFLGETASRCCPRVFWRWRAGVWITWPSAAEWLNGSAVCKSLLSAPFPFLPLGPALRDPACASLCRFQFKHTQRCSGSGLRRPLIPLIEYETKGTGLTRPSAGVCLCGICSSYDGIQPLFLQVLCGCSCACVWYVWVHTHGWHVSVFTPQGDVIRNRFFFLTSYDNEKQTKTLIMTRGEANVMCVKSSESRSARLISSLNKLHDGICSTCVVQICMVGFTASKHWWGKTIPI